MRYIKSNLKTLSLAIGCFICIQIFTSFTLNSNIRQTHSTNEFISSNVSHKVSDIQVYICKGPTSKRYHYNKSCRGLNSCSTKIYKVSLSEAEEIGRTLCGWED